ncbi:hypothetical protein Tco_0491928 [Tanacetum coccineum]
MQPQWQSQRLSKSNQNKNVGITVSSIESPSSGLTPPQKKITKSSSSANAAWNMVAEYVSKLDDGDETKLTVTGNTAITGDGGNNGTFFRAVLLVLESYERAYTNMKRQVRKSKRAKVGQRRIRRPFSVSKGKDLVEAVDVLETLHNVTFLEVQRDKRFDASKSEQDDVKRIGTPRNVGLKCVKVFKLKVISFAQQREMQQDDRGV